MTNADYWKQRFTQLEAAQNRKGAGAYLEIEKQYKAAQNELEAQIARWYQRFADSNGISLAQAKQWLKGQDLAEFKWDVKEYVKYGKENAINGAWMQELENASSKFHISRLEALQIQTQNSLETMFAQQMGTMKKRYPMFTQAGTITRPTPYNRALGWAGILPGWIKRKSKRYCLSRGLWMATTFQTAFGTAKQS